MSSTYLNVLQMEAHLLHLSQVLQQDLQQIQQIR